MSEQELNADNTNTDAASDAASAADTLYPQDADADPAPADPAPEGEGDQSPAEGGDAEPSAEDVVPETYEFQFPEGVTPDPELVAGLEQFSKENKLTAGQAQKLADLGSQVGAKIATQQAAQHAAEVQAWAESSKADAEFGGDKLEPNLGIAKTALDQFASPELREMLKTSGLGNHPEVIRAFYRVGKATSVDGDLVRGQATKGAPKSAADVLYGKK